MLFELSRAVCLLPFDLLCLLRLLEQNLWNLKDDISYDNEKVVEKYLNTIKAEELETYVVEISSDKYKGRMTGEDGHNEVCNYIRDYYKSLLRRVWCSGST